MKVKKMLVLLITTILVINNINAYVFASTMENKEIISDSLYFNKINPLKKEFPDGTTETYQEVIRFSDDEYLAVSRIGANADNTFALTKLDLDFNVIEKQFFYNTNSFHIEDIKTGFLVGKVVYDEVIGWNLTIEEYDLSFKKLTTVQNYISGNPLKKLNSTTSVTKIAKNRLGAYYVTGELPPQLYCNSTSGYFGLYFTLVPYATSKQYGSWRNFQSLYFDNYIETIFIEPYYYMANGASFTIPSYDVSGMEYHNPVADKISSISYIGTDSIVLSYSNYGINKDVLALLNYWGFSDSEYLDKPLHKWAYEFEEGIKITEIRGIKNNILVIGNNNNNLEPFIALFNENGELIYNKTFDETKNYTFKKIINVADSHIDILAENENAELSLINFSVQTEYFGLSANGNLELLTNLENSMKINISNNSISFNEFNGLIDTEDSFQLEIESSLNYDVFVKLKDEIRDIKKPNLIFDKSKFIISSDYVDEFSFSEVNKPYLLINNATGQMRNSHNIKLKLKASRNFTGQFKTDLIFQAKQK